MDIDTMRDALNRAGDDVAEYHGLRDSSSDAALIHLMVNVAGYYAEHPAATLREAVESSYGTDGTDGTDGFEEVMSWSA